VEKLQGRTVNACGVKRRRRTRYTAKSSSEVCATVLARDIRMGKPAQGHACGSADEHIVGERGTGRTETSQ